MPPRYRYRVSGTSAATNGISVGYTQTFDQRTSLGPYGYSRPRLDTNVYNRSSSAGAASAQITTLGLYGYPSSYGPNYDLYPKAVSTTVAIVATTAAITLAPQAATVSASGPVHTNVTATAGSITLASQDATVGAFVNQDVTATSAAITLTAQDATAKHPESGNLWFNNKWFPAPFFGPNWWAVASAAKVSTSSASITIAAQPATVHANVDLHVTATSAAITIAPQAASVTAAGDLNVTATSATITLTPQNATVVAFVETNVTATAASITLAKQDATVVTFIGTSVIATAASIVLTTFDATVTAASSAVNIIASSAAISLSSYPAVVRANKDHGINGGPSLVIATNYQSKTLYCSPSNGYFTID